MIQKPTNQSFLSSTSADDEPTETKIPIRRLQTRQRKNPLQVRQGKASMASIDEAGVVKLFKLGQGGIILQPDEAYDLLDFLFEHRDLLANRSAESAEQS